MGSHMNLSAANALCTSETHHSASTGETMGNDAIDQHIVVADEHFDMVLGLLGRDSAKEEQSDARLGLTLVQLADVHELAQHMEKERKAQPGAKEPDHVHGPLDRVLGNLRAITQARYAGWSPTMGKNRILTGVQFKPYSNAGGFTKPTKPEKIPDEYPSASRSGRRVRVGILDTRLDPHSRLGGRYLTDPDALTRPEPGQERQWWEGHATFIAGIVLSLAPTADLDVRTALAPGKAPDEGWTMPLWTLAERLADYHHSGVQVLNLSLGCSTADGQAPMVLERAIARLTPTMAVVAAAGNHGTDRLDDDERKDQGMPRRAAPLFPAALDGVLAVGAIDAHGKSAPFNPVDGTDPHRPAPWIDVLAPGVEITSTYLGDTCSQQVLVPNDDKPVTYAKVSFGGYANWSGTSFAAAYVTGLVAARIAEGMTPPEAVQAVRQDLPRP
jgi:membrane-anchored mycosin MYCP